MGGWRSAWAWAACLAPAVASLPGATNQSGGWIGLMLALPVVWVVDWALDRVGAEGFEQAICRGFGRWGGRALYIIYIVWAMVLGGVQLRTGVLRMETAVTLSADLWVLSAGILLLALWMIRGSEVACVWWSRFALCGLLLALGAIALLALRQVCWDSLLPLWGGETGILGTFGMTVAVLCVRVYGGFVPGSEKRTAAYPVLVCVVLSALLLTVEGNLGTELAARLEDPLLTLSRNVGVEGAFQRAESLLAAVLLFGDLALLTLLLWSARRMWSIPAAGTAVGAGMFVLANLPVQPVQLEWVRNRILPVGNLALGLGVPLFLLGIGRWKDGKTGAHLVPGKEENGTS